MASQVLSGTSNVSYTNNTGQNVRIVINYMKTRLISGLYQISMSWAGVSISSPSSFAEFTIGRNLASRTSIGLESGGLIGNNLSGGAGTIGLPTELMLAPGQTFAATGIDAYNVVVIPENG